MRPSAAGPVVHFDHQIVGNGKIYVRGIDDNVPTARRPQHMDVASFIYIETATSASLVPQQSHPMAGFKNLLCFMTAISAVHALTLEKRATGGYVQVTSGNASFTMYSGCGSPACGVAASGFTAAMNQLSFGSEIGLGPGDACGRCFALTGDHDPYSPAYTGPFGQSIVVKVTDLCPVDGNAVWCSQTVSSPVNQMGQPFHFDLCEDTGAAAPFFPSGHGALTGSFTEVSCSEWSGSDGSPLWTGACIEGESAGLWPAVGCGNQGTAPGAPSGPVTTPSSAPTSASSTPPASPTTSAPGALQTQYGQCGGTGYTGPTTCASPFTCIAVSPPYYYQCQ